MIKIYFLFLTICLSVFSNDLAISIRSGMGTYISISLPKNNDKLKEGLYTTINNYEQKFSTFKSNSEISNLNKKKSLIVSEEFLELLQISKNVYSLSNGAFDPSVGIFTKSLYKFGTKEAQIPKKNSIKKALLSVNMQNIKIENSKITLPKNTILDFGGIAKGYAVQKAADKLIKHGLKKGIIAISGDMFILSPQVIKIADPFKPNETIYTFKTIQKNSSISTSGNYNRYITSTKNNHLINPKSGASQQKVASVTIIAIHQNTLIDALATAVSVMKKKDAIDMLNKLNNIAYIIIYNDRNILKSSNLHLFLKEIGEY